MNRLSAVLQKPRGVYWSISAALISLGITMLIALGIQGFSSQHLIEHKFWVYMLESISADHTARINAGHADSLPSKGLVRSWYLENGNKQEDIIATAPLDLKDLPPGVYSTEDGYGIFMSGAKFKGHDAFHAMITDLPHGKLITVLDIKELEDQQNRNSILSAVWIVVLVSVISGVMLWLHINLVRPVRDLAKRMQSLDPSDAGARIPANYKREEIQIIAQASNAHLERVEKFIERERSLLDQASHEFRTPIAVISGALDILKQSPLPDASIPAISRMENAITDLSETMVALLYLAREAPPENAFAEVTVLHDLLPRLIQDHEHLIGRKTAKLKLGELEPTYIAAPESIVRIAVSNLIRNAIENTDDGFVELKLQKSIVSIIDSGSGFNPVEAARRYRDSLRNATPIRGQGLGMFLIGRICDRFDWKLSIHSMPSGGTHAALNLIASKIEL